MVTTKFAVMIFNPKVVSNGSKLVFQVADAGKDKVARYFTVMCNNNDLLQGLAHKEKVKLTTINGISLSRYNNKTQTTLFCEVERLGSTDEMNYDGNDTIKISDEDLPF